MYALVAATELKPSHNWSTMALNRDYPGHLQGRAYTGRFGRTAASVVGVQTLEPAHVLDLTRFPWGGPPICTRDGVVIAGNHRTMLLQRAALGGAERDVRTFSAYIHELSDWFRYRGLRSPCSVELDRLVLVRVLDERSWVTDWNVTDASSRDALLRRLNLLSDRPPAKAYDVASGGIAIASSLLHAHGAMRQDALQALSRHFAGASLRQGLSGSGAFRLIEALTRWGALSPAEHAGLIDPDANELSAAGRERMMWMIRALVVDDRTLLMSTPRELLARLDYCWGELLAAVVGPSGAIVRGRLGRALSLAKDAHISGGGPRDYTATQSFVSPSVSKVGDSDHQCDAIDVDLANCIFYLQKRDLALTIQQWVDALSQSPGGDGELSFDGFEPAAGTEGSRERAALAAGVAGVARRHIQRRPVTTTPEDYLSGAEWVALEPLLAPPTDRESPSTCGGRPTVSNRALAAGLVCAFTLGATPETLIATWSRLPRSWRVRRLVGGPTTLKRRLARVNGLPGGCTALFETLERLASARRSTVLSAL